MCVYFVFFVLFFFFFKQKTAYEMRISDWSSDVCSSDLSREVEALPAAGAQQPLERHLPFGLPFGTGRRIAAVLRHPATIDQDHAPVGQHHGGDDVVADPAVVGARRSEERRVGKECARKCRSRWAPDLSKNKTDYLKINKTN